MKIYLKLIPLAIVSFFLVATLTSSSPKFGLPIDCQLGKDCYIMKYVDRDPSSNAIDYACGRLTSDQHKGTDFAIPNLQVMANGVPVKAIASGQVLRRRDGVQDKLVVDQNDIKAVANQECGNGIVIDHGNGWESQYCHLKQNSIVVKPGMKIEKGTILGMVGASGLASFPHVHLTLRHQGEVIDPFVGITTEVGCNVKRQPLWDTKLDYVPTGLIDAGFSDEVPTQENLWQGKFNAIQISPQTPLLIFWIHAYGVIAGDVETFQLIAPDGQVIINNQKALTKSTRTWMSYVGKRNKDTLKTGVWQGHYQLKRDNQIIIDIKPQLTINNLKGSL